MMLTFTEEHDMLRQSIESFVAKELNPNVEQWEQEGMFPAHEVFKKMGDQGFLGVTKPEAHGGMGLDLSYGVVMAEAMGTCHCGGIPMAVGVQTDMCTPSMARFGSDWLKEHYLAPSIAGDMVGCIGVSESGAGSDVAGLRTTARRDGDDYIINGEKMWITNGTQADWMCMLANTGDGPVHRNKTQIVVPMKTKGVTIARKLDKHGMRASDTAQIYFEDVRVPQRHVIGAEGRGFQQQMSQFQEERLWAAANMSGTLRQALALTTDFTRQRKTFGKALIDNQFIQFKMAELSSEIEALRSLVYRAAALAVEKNDPFDMSVTRLASMAKFKSGRLGREVLDWCVQFHGGMGYMTETRVNRLYRDVRLNGIGGGADEIMLGIIAKLEGFQSI